MLKALWKTICTGMLEFDSNVIEQGIQCKEYRKLNPRIAAYLFISMVAGYSTSQYIMGLNQIEDFDVDEVLAHFVTVFLNGIKSS